MQEEHLPTTVTSSAAQALVDMARVLKLNVEAPHSSTAYASVINKLVRTIHNYGDSSNYAIAVSKYRANESFVTPNAMNA